MRASPFVWPDLPTSRSGLFAKILRYSSGVHDGELALSSPVLRRTFLIPQFGTRAAALERLVPRRLAPTSRKISDFSWYEIPHLSFMQLLAYRHLFRTPADPFPAPIQEPPDPPENPDVPVREPDPEDPGQI